jgi:hypothetical protein
MTEIDIEAQHRLNELVRTVEMLLARSTDSVPRLQADLGRIVAARVET